MKKIFASVFVILASVFVASAQQIIKEEDFKSFTGIYVQDDIVLKLHHGSSYNVKLEVDERVADYCKIFLNDGVMTVDVDMSAFPKELKSQLRQKNNNITYVLNVIIPESNMVTSITLKENSKMYADANLHLPAKCQILLYDNAYTKFHKIICDDLTVRTVKKSSVEGSVSANCFNMFAGNSTETHYTVDCKKAEIEVEGSAKVNMDLRSEATWVTYSGFSKTYLKGTSTNLNITGKGASELDANSLISESANVNLANCTCKINAMKSLGITLSNGAKLEYEGEPAISIKKISVSSVTRAQDAKK